MKTKSKKDIEEAGVEKFNETCRSKVLEYAEEWKKTIDKLGRWADMDNAYKTMDLDYMESIWWVFKQLWDKGLIYEGYKSMHVCPRCETTLSQSEVAEGYKDIKDVSVTVKFELADEPGTYILAWTTTPWTLFGNVALAVGADIEYVLVKTKKEAHQGSSLGVSSPATGKDLTTIYNNSMNRNYVKDDLSTNRKQKGEPDIGPKGSRTPREWLLNPARSPELGPDRQNSPNLLYQEKSKPQNEKYILAKEKIDILDCDYEIIKEFKGKDLVGKKYKPLFPYYENSDLENKENLYTIQAAPFVSTEEGTGIVHIAPAFGEDDLNLAKEKNLPILQHVTMDGHFTNEVKGFTGLNVKPADSPQATDLKVIKYLENKNLLFSQEEYEHSYPHCWRCETPLLNYATSSWFVNVTKIKDRALKLAEEINWSPGHIKKGRFGKWLEGARDWSISRQRFWASVIPIWKCACGEIKVFGSIDDLRKEIDEKITKLTFVRHGESERNILNIKSRTLDKFPLTQKGQKGVEKLAREMKEKVDLIISSPVLRAKQTAEILAKKLGAKILYDDLIIEYHHGSCEDLSYGELLKNPDYKEYTQLKKSEEKFDYRLGKTGETKREIVKRVDKFIKKVSKEYAGKNILVVSHAGIKAAINKVLNNISLEQYFVIEDSVNYDALQNFYVNEQGETFDLHKHIIDKIEVPCGKCRAKMKRVPDVLDCWFESSSMPYAQMHYPFENKEKFEANFPAEFIAEGSDQTRAWFYYLHIIATAIFDKPAFKNVIVNGIVLATDGKKMSKRLKNYPEPEIIMDKYGADALRYYLLASPVMAAENFNFSEDGVKEAYQKVILLLSNILSFYQMYADVQKNKKAKKQFNNLTIEQFNSKNILDKWIIAKLNLLVREVTKQMDSYDLIRSVRPIQDFIGELSTWYIRRSRDRFKNVGTGRDQSDRNSAITTLREVLLTLSKVIAPFTPFIAEHIYKELNFQGSRGPLPVRRSESEGGTPTETETSPQKHLIGSRDPIYPVKESVHLEDWPKVQEKLIDKELISQMDLVRQIASLGLERRASAGIPVRQPLAKITVGGANTGWLHAERGADMRSELEQILKDELNILEINWASEKGELAVELDTKLTPELEAAGIIRDLTRHINALRKQKGLTIKDRINIVYETKSQKIKSAIKSGKDKILADTLADGIKEENVDNGKEVKVKDEVVKLGIE